MFSHTCKLPMTVAVPKADDSKKHLRCMSPYICRIFVSLIRRYGYAFLAELLRTSADFCHVRSPPPPFCVPVYPAYFIVWSMLRSLRCSCVQRSNSSCRMETADSQRPTSQIIRQHRHVEHSDNTSASAAQASRIPFRRPYERGSKCS